jgi:hypothetical protein
MSSIISFRAKSSLRRDLLGVLLAVILFSFFGARQAYDEYRLSRHSQSTDATVTSKRGGHGWIEYEYAVQGRVYRGSTPATATGKLGEFEYPRTD